MKEEYNWKSLFLALSIIIFGIILCALSSYTPLPWNNLLNSIGCSLIASGIVITVHDFFTERKTVSSLDDWKIEKIYSTRAEKNAESDPELTKVKYCIDVIAFGLSSFRSKHTSKIETCLRKGVNIRILTMNPTSPYVNVRDTEEKKQEGTTRYSIEQLIKWANDLNRKDFKGKIIVKGYSTMTLNFYWRVDDVLYIGPYWYGVDSQQTITYKFSDGGKGFQQYTDYFENLWNDSVLTDTLTDIKEFISKKRYNKKTNFSV